MRSPGMSASLIGRCGVKRFQTIHGSSCNVARGLVLLSGIGTYALPSWDTKMRRNNLSAALPVVIGRSKRTCELTSSVVPQGTSFHRWVEFECPPIALMLDGPSCNRNLSGPFELSTVNPDNGMDRPCSNRVNGNAAEAQLIREKERAMTDIATHNDRIATIGMDLGKRSFHLIGMDARGKVIMRQQLSRGRFERHMANLQPCLVGVEACAGALTTLRTGKGVRYLWRCAGVFAANLIVGKINASGSRPI